jgi:succinoglycan biosynthesis protein ExoA
VESSQPASPPSASDVPEAGASTPWPGVSYVIPVLNEADYLHQAVTSILGQRYPGPTEIVLVLGPSTDATDDIAAGLAATDERIRVIKNPDAHIPHALNLGLGASTHPVVVRVDAHTQLPPDYTARAVSTLERTGAVNVGGIMAAVGRPGVQAAVARAYNSRFGLGGGAYHQSDATEGPAESAYLGVMRAAAVAAIGGFDESVRRGEDWELNYRLRRAGHLVWLDPTLRVSYWPRDDWRALGRQFFATGVWRGELVRRLGEQNSLRFFAPPVLVLTIGASVVLVPLLATGALPFWAAGLAGAVVTVPATYLGFLTLAAVADAGSVADRGRFVGVLATMHLAWGAGFVLGAARGAQDAVDTSRSPSSPARSAEAAGRRLSPASLRRTFAARFARRRDRRPTV